MAQGRQGPKGVPRVPAQTGREGTEIPRMKLSSGMKKLAAQRPISTSSFGSQNLQGS